MSALTLQNLKSRTVRNLIGAGTGTRVIIPNPLSIIKDAKGNILQKAWSIATGFGGFLFWVGKGIVGLLGLSISKVWGWIMGGKVFTQNFNWNITDEELGKAIASGIDAFGGSLGGAIGAAAGWVLVGFVSDVLLTAFNPALAAYVSLQVGEQALDEIAARMANLIAQAAKTAAGAGLGAIFGNVRKLWRVPDSEFVKQLKAEVGMTDDQIAAKVAERNKPWTITQWTEEQINKIPNNFWKRFVQQGLSEFDEAFMQAGYVAASAADSWYAMQKNNTLNSQGTSEAIELTFHRNDPTPPQGGQGIGGGA